MQLALKNNILYITVDAPCSSDVLLKQLHQSRKSCYLLYQNLAISRDNVPLRPNTQLHPHDHVCIRMPQEQDDIRPDASPLAICYEDELFLAVHKPAGLLVHSDGVNTAHTLCNRVKNYYIQKEHPYPVRPLHRLDKDTSGLVLFSKLPFFQPWLDAMLAEKKINRTYLAIVAGRYPHARDVIDRPIGRDRHHSGKMRIAASGKPAITKLERLAVYTDHSLLRCQLETGRTHQIRVHLASTHHPLLADQLYGSPSPLIHRLALHAVQLEIWHPLLQKKLTIDCPLPEDMQQVLAHGKQQKPSHAFMKAGR